MTNIRAYGPGKFNTLIDEYVYGLSLDGCCDAETGDVEHGSWYGYMSGNFPGEPDDRSYEDLNQDERDFLAGVAGAIVSVDGQGFVSVEYFDALPALEAAWAEIVADSQDPGADHLR